MTGFFNTTNITDWDTTQAQRLAEILASKGKLQRTPRYKNWADQFRKLREVDKADPGHVEMVLGWYADSCGQQYIPQAYSAQSFRTKWPQLADAATRAGSRHAVVTGDAYELATRLGGLRWPGQEKKDEPQFIQLCLDRYTAYRRRLQSLHNLMPECADKRLVGHLLTHGRDPAEFVLHWVKAVHSVAWSWDGWRGDLLPWAFDVGGQRFRRTARTWCAEYTGQPDRWDRILELLDADQAT